MAIIDVKNLTFRWSKNSPDVLDIPNLEIQRGEHVFIVGESGSGKSSLLNLLGGLVTPQRGQVRIFEHDLTALSAPKRDQFRADNIGYIFQQFNLVPYLSVMDNVLLACQFSKIRMEHLTHPQNEVIRLLQALNFPQELINNRNVSALSVGQQQRVAAARALIGAPKMVIADEPTSALDFNSREAFIKLLFKECEQAGTTLLFVSHDVSLGHLFSRKIDMQSINCINQLGEPDVANH